MRKINIIRIIGVTILFVDILLIILYYYCSPISKNSPYKIIKIEKNMNTRKIASILKNNRIIKSELIFIICSKIMKVTGKMKEGTYLLSGQMPIKKIIKKIVNGECMQIKLTIPEGFTVEQIGERIEKLGLGSKEKIIKIAKEKKLEGFLMPATYNIPLGFTESKILMTLNNNFNKIFNKYKKRCAELNMTPNQVITLASIIEKEAKIDEERPIISAVFHNRLKKNILLESCATVQYIIGYKPFLLYSDLRVESPYNTYLHKGLPPGPICNPGEKSIIASLYPANVDYLYFVSNNDGTHKFSNTLQEHNLAKKHYKKLINKKIMDKLYN